MQRRHVTSRRAFSLLETMVIVVIVGIVAASARPALRLLSDARKINTAQEVERNLLLARTLAMTTGRSTGVVLSTNEMRVVKIDQPGDAPSPVLGADGAPRGVLTLHEEQRDAWITLLRDGAGSTTTSATVWFDINGTPELRDASGALLGPCVSDVNVYVAGVQAVTVRRVTGMVERR